MEIGGTVGDIESLPFLESIRQLRNELGRENSIFVHLTLVPFISTSSELKTKPTQHSVKELREIGIQPDILLCRTDRLLPKEINDVPCWPCQRQRQGRMNRCKMPVRADLCRAKADGNYGPIMVQ